MRLFFGVALEENVKKNLSELASEAKRLAGGRATPKERFHITVKFLGEVEPKAVPKLGAIARACVDQMEPVPLTLEGWGYFGRQEEATVWCGVKGAEPLKALSRRLERALGKEGLPFDQKPFRAHITLLRQADARKLAQDHLAPRALEARASGLTLFRSVFTQQGLSYLPLETFPFQKNN